MSIYRSPYARARLNNIDGGSSRNDELMRFQARLSGINVLRSENPENTAAGIFYLNAVSSGLPAPLYGPIGDLFVITDAAST